MLFRRFAWAIYSFQPQNSPTAVESRVSDVWVLVLMFLCLKLKGFIKKWVFCIQLAV
jgi:hypothetical protein